MWQNSVVMMQQNKELLTRWLSLPNWLKVTRCWLMLPVGPLGVGGANKGARGVAGLGRCQTKCLVCSFLQRSTFRDWAHTQVINFKEQFCCNCWTSICSIKLRAHKSCNTFLTAFTIVKKRTMATHRAVIFPIHCSISLRDWTGVGALPAVASIRSKDSVSCFWDCSLEACWNFVALICFCCSPEMRGAIVRPWLLIISTNSALGKTSSYFWTRFCQSCRV